MSDLSDRSKRVYIMMLKKFKKAIMNFSSPSPLQAQVEILESHLKRLEEASTGDLKETVQTTLKKIKDFKMHDTTRFEVCRWVQTIICELNWL